jgi:nitrous oxidase accessory protein NosD
LAPPIVHRDLKPANILVQKREAGPVELRIADFGVGCVAVQQALDPVRRNTITRGDELATSLRGAHTPLYASPQQMRRAEPDPRDDVHALGVIWWQLLTGDLGSGRPAGRGWRRKLSDQGMADGLIDLLESCFDDDPAERPADAALLSVRLEEMLSAPLPRPSASSIRQPTGRPANQTTLTVSRQGAADYRSIKAASRAAPPHARILVRPGVYQEALVLDKPIELIGDGPLPEVILESTLADCILMQTDEAVVRGLTLRSRAGRENGRFYAVDVPRGRLLLENCDITSDSLACIVVHGEQANPTVRNCRIHDGKDCGVHVYDRGRGTFEGCEIHGNALSGAAIRTGGNPVFRRCLVRDGSVGGFLIYDQGEGLVEDCDIVNNEYAGVEIKQGGNPMIRRCRISRSKQGSGVHCYDRGLGTVEECEIFGNSRAGIRIREHSTPTIRRCRIFENEGGLYIQEQSLATLEHCEILGNQRAGVDVMQGASAEIRFCRITGNGYEAIWIHDNARAVVENCDLTGNQRGAWDIADGCQVQRSGNRE